MHRLYQAVGRVYGESTLPHPFAYSYILFWLRFRCGTEIIMMADRLSMHDADYLHTAAWG